MMRIAGLIVLSLLYALRSDAQKIKLQHADVLKGGQVNGVRVARPVGHVVFNQQQTTIYCDSAILNKAENTLEAFGRIRITEGDSITITAGSLVYDGNRKIARLRRNVVFTKLKALQLYTDHLDYYRRKDLALYFNGGRLVDTTNVLKSRKGYLNTITNLASFKGQVVGENRDFTFESDTLQYQTRTKVITFVAPSTVVDKDGKIARYNSGFYNTITKLSTLNNGVIESKSNRLKGNRYQIDDKNLFYRAIGDVQMEAKEDRMTIYGDQGDYNKRDGITKVYGNPWVVRVEDQGDTLFLRADTLVSIDGQDGRTKHVLAYNNVRVFKSDLQAVSDSLSYTSVDSTMTFFGDPVLWNLENQMTADTIHMVTHRREVERILMKSNSFVIAEDELRNYNQIKGRKMTAYVNARRIHHVDVEGNGESLYFALEEKKIANDSLTARLVLLTGMNKIICSNMKINFLEGKVDNISFYVKPDARFIPPQDMAPDDEKLKGFVWRAAERPIRRTIIPRKTRSERHPGTP